jgi:hypothetical protein
MTAPVDQIRHRIAAVAQSELELPAGVAQDLAFHLTDWLDDFNALSRIFTDPTSATDSDIAEFLMRFLVHVPNHLAAASKLATGIPVTDVFGVGATDDDPT